MAEEVCCPKFNPETMEEKEITFKDKLFIKKTTPQIFHMPIPWTYGKTISETCALLEKEKATDKDFMMLSFDPSPWKSELYFSVTREVPGAENVRLSGTYLTKVFDGPYNHVPKWLKVMETYLETKGKKAKKYYFYYTTCPKCAKKYGHNYVVIFAQV
jgi:hypothetical protein